jgi:hypothetical protein
MANIAQIDLEAGAEVVLDDGDGLVEGSYVGVTGNGAYAIDLVVELEDDPVVTRWAEMFRTQHAVGVEFMLVGAAVRIRNTGDKKLHGQVTVAS